MPLVRIDLNEAMVEPKAEAVSEAIHRSIVSTFGIPNEDKFHVINMAQPGHLVALDAGLGFERGANVVMVQIFTQRGRTTEAKQALYRSIFQNLLDIGVPGTDVFIGYQENGPEDWSFGFGLAQYLTGELNVPPMAAS